MAYGGGLNQQVPFHLVQESVQNPRDSHKHVDEIVGVLQSYMKSHCGLKASEVLKGGSLGQGTAIPGEFDLDLVVYSVDISCDDMLDPKTLRDYLLKIHALLSKYLIISGASLTNHGLRFMYKELPIDLLPSPYFSSPGDLHDFLAEELEPDERRMFSCSAAKWLKQFISKQPDQVKEYIKRAKSWRNNKWPAKQNSDGRPKSILISLLVIEAYGRSASGGAQSVTDLMKNDVRGHQRLRIAWAHSGALYHMKFARDYPKAEPYIIDPSNPFNNVYKSGIGHYTANSNEGTYYQGDGNWSNFVRYIDSMDLRKNDGTRY